MRATGPQRGFTILELLVVVVITGVLSTVVVQSFSRVHGRMAVGSAQNNLMSLHSQARAFSVERGIPARFVVDGGTDEVRLEVDGDGGVEVLNRFDLQAEFAVDVQLSSSPMILCFTPRGVASPGCGNVTSPVEITLTRGNRSGIVEILPLGQARVP